MKFKGVVKDFYYDTDGNNSTRSGFETADEAFEWAKKTAEETGFTNVSYWVDPEDFAAEKYLSISEKLYWGRT